MDEERVFARELVLHLPHGLEERLALDVADRAADLDDPDFGVRLLERLPDELLDLVGDVRNHLDGLPEEGADPLLADDVPVDLSGRHVVGGRELHVDEPLVAADVEVGLLAVVGDEHLAVLVGVHRPGIDIDVRVDLLETDAIPLKLEQETDGGRDDALTEPRQDPACDEDELLQRGSAP